MEYEWHEAKRLATLAKHGLDFRDAETIFEGPPAMSAARKIDPEERWLVTGCLKEFFITIVFTLRDDRLRLISMRMARDDERQRYQALYGRGTSRSC